MIRTRARRWLSLVCLFACGNHGVASRPSGGTACTLDTTYYFGTTGGLVDTLEWQKLSPPLTYTSGEQVRGELGGECLHAMTCGENITSNLLRAFTDPEVARAFAANVRVYGYDPREADGQVYVVRRADGHTIRVGTECTGGIGPTCVAIPAGVQRLITQLQTLGTHVWIGGTCHDVSSIPAEYTR